MKKVLIVVTIVITLMSTAIFATTSRIDKDSSEALCNDSFPYNRT